VGPGNAHQKILGAQERRSPAFPFPITTGYNSWPWVVRDGEPIRPGPSWLYSVQNVPIPSVPVTITILHHIGALLRPRVKSQISASGTLRGYDVKEGAGGTAQPMT